MLHLGILDRLDPDTTFEIEGRELSYPTRFRDGSSMMVMMAASADRVQDLISETPFVVAQPMPTKAVVGVNCVHYTDTDCGSYEEIALSVFVEPMDREWRIPWASALGSIIGGEVPSYTWRLGVSSTLSRDCGLRMWGFPKALAELRHTSSPSRERMSWRDGGDTVLELALPGGGRRRSGPISPPVYSLISGRPHVGRLTQSYRGVGYHRRRVEFMLGDHPIADELRDLGLSRPLIGVHNQGLTFEMSAPQPLVSRDLARPVGVG